MSRRALTVAVAGVGFLAACAAARAPAGESGSRKAGGGDASVAAAAPVDPAAPGLLLDAGPGAPAAPEAAAAARADASAGDDDRAGGGLVFDLGVARSGESTLAALVNVEAFRAHPVGRVLGPALESLPEWKRFSHGMDLGVAWVLFTSQSLVHAERGTLIAYCTAPDAKIDRWLDGMAADHGGPVDAGAGVHATAARIEGLERVFMRPLPHLVAIAPAASALEVAARLKDAHLPAHADPAEGVRVRVKNPQRLATELPPSVTEVRFWLAPRKDRGADFFFEADTPGATMVAQQLHDLLASANDPALRSATLGLIDHPEITADGDVAKVHVRVNEAQLQAIVQRFLTELR